MKCLTVHQPYASLIVAGVKRVENRTWTTRHRGPLLIHAGRSYDPDAPLPPDCPDVRDLPYGAIIGRVTLLDCVPLAEAPPGPHTHGPFCWLLGDAVQFDEPIYGPPDAQRQPTALKGQVGLWTFAPPAHARCDHCRRQTIIEAGAATARCGRCGQVFELVY